VVSQLVASQVVSLVSQFPAFGFSGSRSPSSQSLAVVGWLLARLPSGCRVLVGCAAGVDAAVRSAVPAASVFSVASGVWGSGRGAFAARSSACVRAVAAAGGLWCSFPAGACPAGLLPSRSSAFCGSGSGSWGSLAFAVALGVPCLVWLPPGVTAPSGWGLSELGRGWWVFQPASQLALF
jgi:hypothetical protein